MHGSSFIAWLGGELVAVQSLSLSPLSNAAKSYGLSACVTGVGNKRLMLCPDSSKGKLTANLLLFVQSSPVLISFYQFCTKYVFLVNLSQHHWNVERYW